MTLILERWQVWSRYIHNCAESVTLQHVCGYKYAEDIHEYTEDTVGMPKVGYILVTSHIWCSGSI